VTDGQGVTRAILKPGRAWGSSFPGGLAVAVTGLALVQACAAATFRAGPENYLPILGKLQPGDTLMLAPGLYSDGLPVHRMAGAPGRPIVIRGPRAQPPARFLARRGAHTVSIINSAWVEIHDLELDGNGLPVAAVRAEGHADWAHHITLNGLLIKGHGADQSIVGIAVFCPAWNWVIRNNVIVGAGTGMYLGQSDGTAPFIAGIIEGNVITDTIGYNLQIKHQQTRPLLQGMPQKSSVTIIRRNVFAKSANSSVDKMARPNLLVGHWPKSGPGAEDTYVIYGNFFHQNPTEALFQGEGNVAFYSNVLVNTGGSAVHIQPHNDVPRRVDIFHNTVLAGGNGIRVTGGHPEHAQRIFANAVFAETPIAGGEQHSNITGLPGEAAEYLAQPNEPPGRLNLAPRRGRLRIAPYDFLPIPGAPDAGRDFDGRIYRVPMAGAYSENRPQWHLQVAPKPRSR